MRDARHRRGAFTIVELMVVIGILALLMGLLLPALGGVHRKSLKTQELNALREVGLAWQLYSGSNRDQALPGFIDTDVQKNWQVAYQYPNHARIPPAPNYGGGDPNIAGPWTWRLMSHLNYSHDMVHGHLDEPSVDPTTLSDDDVEVVRIAYQPAFGYNAFYVGGWWKICGNEAGVTPHYLFSDAIADRDGNGTIDAREYASVVVRSVPTIRRSSELIIFCSSSKQVPGVYRKWRDDQAGWHCVVPPWLGDQAQWTVPGALGGGPSGAAVAADDNSLSTGGGPDSTSLKVEVATAAPIGRYTRLAATLYADLHHDVNTPGALHDMRKWIDVADKANFKHQTGEDEPPCPPPSP